MLRFNTFDIVLSPKGIEISIHPMLRFNSGSNRSKKYRSDDFNTSYVTVQRTLISSGTFSLRDFNTSYVTVQPFPTLYRPL